MLYPFRVNLNKKILNLIVVVFIQFSCNQLSYKEHDILLCHCTRYRNIKQHDAHIVSMNLYMKGFKKNCYVLTNHRENCYDIGNRRGQAT